MNYPWEMKLKLKNSHFCVCNEFTVALRTHNLLDKKKIGHLLTIETMAFASYSQEMIGPQTAETKQI